MKKLTGIVFCLLVLLSASTGAVFAKQEPGTFPEVIPLPNGFQPEGIVIGRGTTFYVGSLADGSIFQGDLATGEGAVLVPPQEGRVAVGLGYDPRTNYVYAAGGGGGAGYVYDASTGESVADFQFTSENSFVNDVVVTLTGAYFTDSMRPYIYRVPLSLPGSPPDPSAVEEIQLTGDFEFVPEAFNTNGIAAVHGGLSLIIINSSLGALYWVDPKTGEAQQVDLGGETLMNGDGLLRVGSTLYVVQNRLNQIAVVEFQGSFLSAQVVDVLTDPDFDVPTTIDNYQGALYAVNARFGTPPTPETEYQVVRVPLE
jgi:sugar lactone lactonase YvrE